MNDAKAHRSDLPWWKQTTVYQIYPRSFYDRNGDGIGDLEGVIDRLDYLQWLGVETIWLSPFFTSPQADFGYDISDHFDVAPEYGSLEQCHRLFDEAHARGMKVVLDMVLNHTSDQHPWFLESRSSRDNPYRDFYIWRDGRKPNGAAPPNNWSSMLGGSGWNHDPQTDQWYWSSFLPFQPDLNYRNPRVKSAMLDVVRHWLRAGADGFRLDIFNAIYKDASFANNPRSLRIPSEDNPAFFQRALHTQNHPVQRPPALRRGRGVWPSGGTSPILRNLGGWAQPRVLVRELTDAIPRIGISGAGPQFRINFRGATPSHVRLWEP
jgi:glycosidase